MIDFWIPDDAERTLLLGVCIPGLPPSVNGLYNNRVVSTKDGPRLSRAMRPDARQWKDRAIRTIHDAWRETERDTPRPGQLIDLKVVFCGMSWRRDTDGGQKVLQDACAEAIGFNDRAISDLQIRRAKKHPEWGECSLVWIYSVDVYYKEERTARSR